MSNEFETKVWVVIQDWKGDTWYGEYPDFDSAICDIEQGENADEIKGIIDDTEKEAS